MKKRRASLVRGIQHVMSINMCSLEAYEVEWLRDQLKAAIRVVRKVDNVLNFYEEDFQDDVRRAVRDVLEEKGLCDAYDKSTGEKRSSDSEEEIESSCFGGESTEGWSSASSQSS